MPFVAAPNIVMAEVRALLDGQKIENRLMVNANAPVTPTILDSIAVLVNDWAQATYFDVLPLQVSLTEVVTTDLTTATGGQHSIAPTGPFVGAYTGGSMPNETSFCVSLRSASRGRSARGRAFVLAVPRDQVGGNYVTAPWAASAVAAFQTLIDDLHTAGFDLTVVSYIADNAPRVGGPVYFTIVTALAVDLTLDSMKSRKPGVGS